MSELILECDTTVQAEQTYNNHVVWRVERLSVIFVCYDVLVALTAVRRQAHRTDMPIA